jgi:uncharacterized membrane protein (UPF0136 family)
MPAIAKMSLLVFAALVAAGGVMGFVKAQSKPSLISGVVSAILLAVCFFVTNDHPNTGLLAGWVLTDLLFVVFAIRLAKTKKFMPSGMMLALCAIESVLLLSSIDWSGGLKFD